MHAVLRLLAVVALVGVFNGSARAVAADGPKQLRIGYQKSSLLQILKEQSLLEKRFAPQGIAVTWVEFQSGPPLLEALNAGAIDVGYTGDTPPIFAQAAGASLVYVASFPVPGQSSGVLVRTDARINTIADLRGKRVAVTKGSSAHNVLVRVLEKGGLRYGDIQPVYLQPADAAAAIQNGGVDAWVIWDPFYAVGEHFAGIRVLTSAAGIAPSNSFYLAGRDYATRYPAVITATIEEINHAAGWARTHPQELAAELAAQSGVPLDIERAVAARGPYAYHAAQITPDVLRQQQAIADSFARLGLIPHTIDVRLAVWTPDAGKLAGVR